MTLEPGARVGDYAIVGPLGAGGMSEVYRARDLTLGREVAIKILPAALATDPDQRSRFEREAQLLAALNHRNIAVIHGIERDDDTWYLVLELVPGETLAERIKRGPLPLAEARAVFLQIAEALEAAHGKGIIHRDLKPANIKLTSEGTVKLLDFGLGKELGPSVVADDTTTFDGSLTSPGLVMGTPGYMSPEQARGRAMGRGTDIWSFGVCLFEAISGVHPFARDTLPDTLSAILNDAPRGERLPGNLPTAWQKLLDRCLRKNVDDRLHDIADLRIELEEAPQMPDEELAAGPRGVLVPRWAVAAGAAVVALSVFTLWRSATDDDNAVRVVRRFVIDLPPTATLSLDGASSLAVSPDGTRLVYASRRADRSQLHLRALDQLETVAIPGTDGALSPFFSPGGGTLGFFADDKLKTLQFPGGSPVTLADAPTPRGASWLEPETRILFAPSSQGGLSLVAPTGGATSSLPDGGAQPHPRWPQILPGGRAALITLWSRDGTDIGIISIGDGTISRLVEDGSYARYAPSGHLVFARGGDLVAAAFDLRSRELRSNPLPVVESVSVDAQTGAAFFAFSNDGTLFYVSEDSEIRSPATMLIVSSEGAAIPIGPPKASFQVPRLSPDGRFVLATVQEGDASDIWSLQIDRGSLTRVTLDGASGAAVWSPDGRIITYSSHREGHHAIYSKSADGSGASALLVGPGNPMFPTSWSPDGRTLAYTELDPETGLDIWLFSVERRATRPMARTAYAEAGAMFSPDGRFLAFTSDESGTEEVYVRAFPGNEGRWQVSTAGGNEPVWSRAGDRLYFRSGSSLMVVAVTTEPSFEATRPRLLLDAPFDSAGALYANYDVGPDGRNFVMIRSEADAAAGRVHVVLYWLDELARRIPVR